MSKKKTCEINHAMQQKYHAKIKMRYLPYF